MSRVDAYLTLRAWNLCLWGSTAAVMLLILVDRLIGGLL